jgi:hypothetical protein
MSPRVTCTNHCDRCNGHFHSLRAFDVHRGEDGCIDPQDDARFVALARDAKCELNRHAPYTPLEESNTQVYPPDGVHNRDGGWKEGQPKFQRVLEPVTVWTIGSRLARARADFGSPATTGVSDGMGAAEASDGSGEGQVSPSAVPGASGGFSWSPPRP